MVSGMHWIPGLKPKRYHQAVWNGKKPSWFGRTNRAVVEVSSVDCYYDFRREMVKLQEMS